ncbi:ComEC/Rec2 family competence protein [Agrobacterium cavarae]
MNDYGERQQFRLLETGTPVKVELDGINAPAALTNMDVVLFAPPSPAPQGFAQRLQSTLSRCVTEELQYRQDFLFIPVLVGAGAALWFSLSSPPSDVVLLVFGLCVIPVAIITRHRQNALSFVLATLALLLLGMLLANWETRRVGTTVLDSAVTTTITGKVERREVDAKGYWRYTIALTSTSGPSLTRLPNRISVLSRSREQPIAVGAGITGKARLSPPSGPALPGLNDFAFSAYFDGIGATGFFYSAPKALPTQAETMDDVGWLETAGSWLYALRSAIAERIRSVIGGDAGAFAASIITDERRAISSETMEALRVSGLAHIVAISGLNMALASGIFFVGMRMVFSLFPGFSQRYPVKKISAFAALLMTFAYYLISGFAVSAERAWLMMSIMLAAVLVNRPSISLRNVALAAIVIIAVSPHEIMGPSFQMSFAATLALVAAYSFWSRWRGSRERLFIARPPLWMVASSKASAVIGGVIITSLIGGVSTAIYSIEHFHRITTYGLAANLAAMPVMSIIVMPSALIAMLLMPFGLDAPFLKLMGYGMAMVIDIANTVSSWGGDATIGRQHSWFLGVSTIGFLLLTLLRTHLALLGLPLILAGLVLVPLEQNGAKPDLLIYEDGVLVAFRTDQFVATTKRQAKGFVFDQWARAVPLPDKHVAPVMLDDDKSGEREDTAEPTPRRPAVFTDQQKQEARDKMRAAFERTNGFSCQKNAWCAGRHESGVKVAVISNTALTGTACDLADIIVTSRFVPFSNCRSGALLISATTLRKTGSLELWLNEAGAPVATARAAMQDVARPWSIHRAYDWRSKTSDGAMPPHIETMLAAGQ